MANIVKQGLQCMSDQSPARALNEGLLRALTELVLTRTQKSGLIIHKSLQEARRMQDTVTIHCAPKAPWGEAYMRRKFMVNRRKPPACKTTFSLIVLHASDGSRGNLPCRLEHQMTKRLNRIRTCDTSTQTDVL